MGIRMGQVIWSLLRLPHAIAAFKLLFGFSCVACQWCLRLRSRDGHVHFERAEQPYSESCSSVPRYVYGTMRLRADRLPESLTCRFWTRPHLPKRCPRRCSARLRVCVSVLPNRTTARRVVPCDDLRLRGPAQFYSNLLFY